MNHSFFRICIGWIVAIGLIGACLSSDWKSPVFVGLAVLAVCAWVFLHGRIS